MTQTTTLADRFAALEAERARTWSPEQLARNQGQRQALVDRHDPSKRPVAGDRLAPFTLIGADGQALDSVDLLANGPAVLVFFRFGGCPACNIALPYYNEALWPALNEAGVPLVAVSAQVPVNQALIDRHHLGFAVASDPGYALGRALGLTFLPDEQPPVKPGEAWIGATLGTDSYEMTQPAVIIVNGDRTIRYIDVSPDWLARTETPSVLAHLPEISRQARAA
jgi:peroxiredoxin